MDTLQINKLSHLHDGKNIIFCKTDYLLDAFKEIREIDNEVILISGNSDYCVDDNFSKIMPNNIKLWFAQNNLTKNDKIITIPLGLDNCKDSTLGQRHGLGYNEKCHENKLIKFINSNITPTKFIYSNFNVNTNFSERNLIKSICQKSEFIDWEEPNLSLDNFYSRILEYEAVVCAQGNGPGDNHRIYETLYLDRIPITFNRTMYENLHHVLPVVLVENNEELYNYNVMRHKINVAKEKKWDKTFLDINYWIKKIKNGHNQF